jgi:hypothetical protein
LNRHGQGNRCRELRGEEGTLEPTMMR